MQLSVFYLSRGRLLINEPLPGRITQSTPIGNKYNISSHLHRRSRSLLLDAPPLDQPNGKNKCFVNNKIMTKECKCAD